MPRGKRKREVAPRAPSPEIYDTIVVRQPPSTPQETPVKPTSSQNEHTQPPASSERTPGGAVAGRGGKSTSGTPARGGKSAQATPARRGRSTPATPATPAQGRKSTRATPAGGGKSTPATPATPAGPTPGTRRSERPRKQLIIEKDGSPIARRIAENEEPQAQEIGSQALEPGDVSLQQQDKTEEEQITTVESANGQTGDAREQSGDIPQHLLQGLASKILAVETPCQLPEAMHTPSQPEMPSDEDHPDVHMTQGQQEKPGGVDTQEAGIALVEKTPKDLMEVTTTTSPAIPLGDNFNVSGSEMTMKPSGLGEDPPQLGRAVSEVKERVGAYQSQGHDISSVQGPCTDSLIEIVDTLIDGRRNSTQPYSSAPSPSNSTETTPGLPDALSQTGLAAPASASLHSPDSGSCTHQSEEIDGEVEVGSDSELSKTSALVPSMRSSAMPINDKVPKIIEYQDLPIIETEANNSESKPAEAPIESSKLAPASPLILIFSEELSDGRGAPRGEPSEDLDLQMMDSDDSLPRNPGSAVEEGHPELSKATANSPSIFSTGLNNHEDASLLEKNPEKDPESLSLPIVALIEVLPIVPESMTDEACIELRKITVSPPSIYSTSELNENEATEKLKGISENLDLPIIDTDAPLLEDSPLTVKALTTTFPSILSPTHNDNEDSSYKELPECLDVPMVDSHDIIPDDSRSNIEETHPESLEISASDPSISPSKVDNHGVTKVSIFNSQDALQNESEPILREADTKPQPEANNESKLSIRIGEHEISSQDRGVREDPDVPMIDSVNNPSSDSDHTSENIPLNTNAISDTPSITPPQTSSIAIPRSPLGIISGGACGGGTVVTIGIPLPDISINQVSAAAELQICQVGDSSGSISNTDLEQESKGEVGIKDISREEDNPSPSNSPEEGHVSWAVGMHDENVHSELWALEWSLGMFWGDDGEEETEGESEREGEEEGEMGEGAAEEDKNENEEMVD